MDEALKDLAERVTEMDGDLLCVTPGLKDGRLHVEIALDAIDATDLTDQLYQAYVSACVATGVQQQPRKVLRELMADASERAALESRVERLERELHGAANHASEHQRIAWHLRNELREAGCPVTLEWLERRIGDASRRETAA